MSTQKLTADIISDCSALLEEVAKFRTAKGPEAFQEAELLAQQIQQQAAGLITAICSDYTSSTLDRLADIDACRADQKIARGKV